MTHNRRGFFGRVAAIFAAPLASKLEPVTDELEQIDDVPPALSAIETTPCPYTFKAPSCGYPGPARECDHSFRRCRSLDNHARFGGFPLLPR